MKKLSLLRVFKESQSQNQISPSDFNAHIVQLGLKYGLNRDESLFLKNIDQKLKNSGTDLFGFSQQYQKFIEETNDQAEVQWPNQQAQGDSFADFEGEEEDPAAAAEAQEWQGMLNRRNELTQQAAQQGYYYDPNQNQQQPQQNQRRRRPRAQVPVGTVPSIQAPQQDPQGTKAGTPNQKKKRK